jgi:hypothetical protein
MAGRFLNHKERKEHKELFPQIKQRITRQGAGGNFIREIREIRG